ncbi:MAG: YciI family protein [Actinomycetota bacterium]
MKYACLIYADEATEPAFGTAEQEEIFAGYAAFSQAVEEAGVFVAGEPLDETATATCVSVRDGETITTDGAFAETKEHLGGFYILECADLDEALRWAAQIPHAARGRVEVRPVPDYGEV